jgi:RNA polymerase sigma factor (sigma-70 family)
MVLEVLGAHAESLLRVARRHSVCLDDAQDAYQRAVEIFLRHATTLDSDEAHKWLHTVCKHEAMAVRKARLKLVGGEEHDLDAHESLDLPGPDEHAMRFERLSRSAEALRRLKPQEVQALWLRAQGHSYQEIADLQGWTYTKVNRCITEGRRSFLSRFEGIESGAECRRWEPVLSALVDGEASAADLAAVRPHLRNCQACRATVRELREANAGLAALLPVPVVAGGLFARLHETLFSLLPDRIAGVALRVQSGVETTGAAKVAAIAASAAAVAGGGVAVQQVVSHPSRVVPHQADRIRPAAARAAAVAASPSVPPRPAPLPARSAPAPRARHTATRRAEFYLARAPRARTAAATRTAAREFAPAPATAASVRSTPAPAPRTAAQRTEAAEFGVG